MRVITAIFLKELGGFGSDGEALLHPFASTIVDKFASFWFFSGFNHGLFLRLCVYSPEGDAGCGWRRP